MAKDLKEVTLETLYSNTHITVCLIMLFHLKKVRAKHLMIYVSTLKTVPYTKRGWEWVMGSRFQNFDT
jgi:hypothetical protein